MWTKERSLVGGISDVAVLAVNLGGCGSWTGLRCLTLKQKQYAHTFKLKLTHHFSDFIKSYYNLKGL